MAFGIEKFKNKGSSLKVMTIDKYVTQNYSIKCKGRDRFGNEILGTPVDVTVKIHKSPGSNTLSSLVDCIYNTGGHGQRCKASHPDVDKVDEGVGCPYSFDIPYALEVKRR